MDFYNFLILHIKRILAFRKQIVTQFSYILNHFKRTTIFLPHSLSHKFCGLNSCPKHGHHATKLPPLRQMEANRQCGFWFPEKIQPDTAHWCHFLPSIVAQTYSEMAVLKMNYHTYMYPVYVCTMHVSKS